jgi:hypothetical protein
MGSASTPVYSANFDFRFVDMLRAPAMHQERAETECAAQLVGWPSYPRDAIRSFFEESVQRQASRISVS